MPDNQDDQTRRQKPRGRHPAEEDARARGRTAMLVSAVLLAIGVGVYVFFIDGRTGQAPPPAPTAAQDAVPDVGDAGMDGMEAEATEELLADDPDDRIDNDTDMPPPGEPGSPDTPQFGD